MEISAKIDKICQGNLNRQTMKLPWTKKQKFPLFNQTSCQEQQQQQRNSSTWPCRFAAGKNRAIIGEQSMVVWTINVCVGKLQYKIS